MISKKFQKAIEFAATAHDGQTRKSTAIPYVSHPFAVAAILQSQGCEEYVVIAGMLHDTVEDTAVKIEDIQNEFGDQIAEIVAGVTEPAKSNPWEVRKKYMIESIKNASHEIKFVSCADKLHNLMTVMEAHSKIGDAVWNRFSRGYAGQKWYGEAMVDSLFFGLDEAHQKPMFFELKKLVGEFFQK